MALTKPGLLGGTAATGYPSIWGQASGGQGILGYTPPGFTPGVGVGAPMPAYKAAIPLGGTPYGNYVRQWPDLLKAFQDPNQTGAQNIADWGKEHWQTFGQWEPGRLAGGRPEDRPVNPYISLGDIMDTGGGGLRTGTSGLPMPDVEGYKYAYRPYEWSQENQAYEELAYNEFDIDKYPYYPYLPTGGRAQERNNRILVGLRLVPD